MEKRIISILLAVCLIFGLLPVGVLAASATSGSCGKNATWSYNAATKTLSISGSGDMTDYETDPAMGIENAPPWDDYREEIEHVIINEGITSIGAEAFGFQYTSFRDKSDNSRNPAISHNYVLHEAPEHQSGSLRVWPA